MNKVLSLSSGDLLTSEENNSLRINWSEEVQFNEYKDILMKAAEEAIAGHVNIIIDRTELGELPAECRVWMKDEYLKVHMVSVIPTLKKVAIIQSKSILGQIYFSTISKAIPLKYPNLNLKSFNNSEAALSWIDSEQDEVLVDTEAKAVNPKDDEKSTNKLFAAIMKLFK